MPDTSTLPESEFQPSDEVTVVETPTLMDRFKTWLKETHPNKRLSTNAWKRVGKILKKDPLEEEKGLAEARAYVGGFLSEPNNQCNFRPPAKANIVALSRPFEEWPIFRASRDIQEKIYALPYSQAKLIPKKSLNAETREEFFKLIGFDPGSLHAQGLNLILEYARDVYFGVEKKINNRNVKAKERHAKLVERAQENGETIEDFVPEPVIADKDILAEDGTVLVKEGTLLQKPGVNPVIFTYQQTSPVVYDPVKHSGIHLPDQYAGYARNAQTPLSTRMGDRLSIPEGEMGWVPPFQRPGSDISDPIRFRKGRFSQGYAAKYKKKGRTYRHQGAYDKFQAAGAILGVIQIQGDYVVFDLRGILRNARWRNLIQEGATTQDLLDLFSGDPVIDPKRNVVTFIYRHGKVPVTTRKVKSTSNSVEAITKYITESTGDVAAIAIDLGQTHPIAAGVYRLALDSEGVIQNKGRVDKFFLENLPGGLAEQVERYRARTDAFEDMIRQLAFNTLSQEQQEEVLRIRSVTAISAKQNLCEMLSLPEDAVDWSTMGSWTFQIADWVLKHGGDSSLVLAQKYKKKTKKDPGGPVFNKDGTPKMVRKNDHWLASLVKPRIPKEIRETLNKTEWELKREHPMFLALSKSKQEFARSVVNAFLHQVREVSKIPNVLLVIEDLAAIKKFVGSGTRDKGWDNFFSYKRENRWFMQVLHKVLSEAAEHKGLLVIEVHPAYTSQTCPECGHCDRMNRNGDSFVCTKCGHSCNADLDTAPFNILRVAITGKGMPHPESKSTSSPRKRSGDSKKSASARKQ